MNQKGQIKSLYYIFMVLLVVIFSVFAFMQINTSADSEGARQRMIVNEIISVAEALDSVNYPIEYDYKRGNISMYNLQISNKEVVLFGKDKANSANFQRGLYKYSDFAELLNVHHQYNVSPSKDTIYFRKTPGNLMVAGEETVKSKLDFNNQYHLYYPSTKKITNSLCFIYNGDSLSLKKKLISNAEENTCAIHIYDDFSTYVEVNEVNDLNNINIIIDKDYAKESLKFTSCFINNLNLNTKDYYPDIKLGLIDKKTLNIVTKKIEPVKISVASIVINIPKNIEDKIKKDVLDNTIDCFNAR